jgi:hypothetical protein
MESSELTKVLDHTAKRSDPKALVAPYLLDI